MRCALHLLEIDADMTPVTIAVSGVASHPEDDLVLATALRAQADDLVTGDRQIIEPGHSQGVAICSARQFIRILHDS